MNIFVLSKDPAKAARFQCDKHVIKMIIESAQMLSTAHRVLDGVKVVSKKNNRKITRFELFDDFELNAILYKAAHINHPCSRWVRASIQNYFWLYDHFVALCDEYTYRYNKIHATDKKLREILEYTPRNIPIRNRTPFALAMKSNPECMHSLDPVRSYREFYQTKQDRFTMKWTNRDVPYWFKLNEGVK